MTLRVVPAGLTAASPAAEAPAAWLAIAEVAEVIAALTVSVHRCRRLIHAVADCGRVQRSGARSIPR